MLRTSWNWGLWASASLLTAAVGCGGDSGSDLSARYVQKLRECSIISAKGKFNVGEGPENAVEVCQAHCLLSASCDDLSTPWCSSGQEEDFSPALQKCIDDCEPHMACKDGSSAKAYKCDGQEDCKDGSDEVGCANFACTNGERVLADYKCDGEEDCSDGSDESDCPKFACKTGGQKVALDYRCDGESDCADDSDEQGCPTGTLFRCTDGTTLPLDAECDVERDCRDGSDEHSGCAKLVCQ